MRTRLRRSSETDDVATAVVEDDVPDQVVDVRIARLEQLPRDVPRLEDAAPDHPVQADAVDDEAVEALDHGVAGLQAEKDDVAAAANAGDGVVHARVLPGHLERHVDADAVGERGSRAVSVGVVGELAAGGDVVRAEDDVGAELLGHLGVVLGIGSTPMMK